MEILELKSAWELLQENIIEKDKVQEIKLRTYSNAKSHSEISQIKKSLYLKFIIAVISIVTALGLAVLTFQKPSLNPLDFIFSDSEAILFFTIMSVSVSLMVYFNYIAYIQIKEIQHSSLNLKDSLKNFIEAMKKAISFNVFSDTLMTPIVFTWFYYAYAFRSHELNLDIRTALLFILPLFISVLAYYLQSFMQDLKFGKYLMRLESYLESLENNSSEL